MYWNGANEAAGWRVDCVYSDGTTRRVDLLHVNTWEWTDRDSRADEKSTYKLTDLYWTVDGKLTEGGSTEACQVSTICQQKPSLDKIFVNDFRLKWKKASDVKVYRLYQKNDVRGMYERIADIDGEVNMYTVPICNAGVLNYILQCETADGIRTNKPIKVYVPEALQKPTGLYVERCEAGNRLLWNTMPGVDGWNIRLCTEDNPNGQKIMELPAGQTWWIDSDSSAAVSYRIEAMRKTANGNQFSGYCKAVRVCSE